MKDEKKRVLAVSLTMEIEYIKGGKPVVHTQLKHKCASKDYALNLISRYVKHMKGKGDA